MLNIKNLRPAVFNLSKRRVINLFIYLILILLMIVGIWIYIKDQRNKNSYKAIENRSAPFTQQDLNSHDYKSYQERLTLIANDYIAQQKYKDAERVLNEITTNVPPDKIISQTYRAYWYLYQQTGDTANRKKYAQLTADKLKQEGQTKAAAVFEADATGK